MAEAKLKKEDIDQIELIGGCSRVPRLKQAIEEFFGRPLSYTLNADEAVARGCAFDCAILSPVFRVRDFSIQDIVGYPIEFTWEKSPEIPDEDESMQPIPVHPERTRCLGHHPVTVMSHSQSQGPVSGFEIFYFTTAYTSAFSDVSSSPLSLKDIRRVTRKLGRNNRPGFRISSLAMTRILCRIPENDVLSFAPPQGIYERPTPHPKANNAPQRIWPDTENRRYAQLLKPFGSLIHILNSNRRPDRYLGDVGKPPRSNPRTTRAVSRKFGQNKGHVLNQ